MSRTNETSHIKWRETCKCQCRLDAIVYNNKQRWNKDKHRCECKELIDKGVCDKEFIWNPSNCECDKSKQPIDLMSGKFDQIVVSDKFKHSDEGYKYFIGYQKDEIVEPLCIILPQMSGYIKYF